MKTLILVLIMVAISIIALILAVALFAKRIKKVGVVMTLICVFLAIIAGAIFLENKIVKVEPDEVAISYAANGKSTTLQTGYNWVPITAIQQKWSSKSQVMTFSEGEDQSDIFGAQTSEKDYIAIVATISVRLDPSQLPTYIQMYGNEQITSNTITKLLKSTVRVAIENVVSKYTTSEVMGNKSKINNEAVAEFIECMKTQPIVIDSFTIDDLVAPASYEESIKEQALLRQRIATAELQKQENEANATANKVKAEGEAAVAKTNAEKEAEVARIEAEKNANVKLISAQNNKELAETEANKTANVNKITAESAVEVAKLEAEKAKTKAESDAEVVRIGAEASANATKMKGDAEAEVANALAAVYKSNPEMYELEVSKINAEVTKTWAEKWSGIDLSGLSPTVSWADVSSLLQGIVNTTANVLN